MSATTGPSRTPETPRRASGPSRKSSWRLAGQIRRWTSASSSPQPLAAPSSCVLASDEADTAIHPRNFRERPLGPGTRAGDAAGRYEEPLELALPGRRAVDISPRTELRLEQRLALVPVVPLVGENQPERPDRGAVTDR